MLRYFCKDNVAEVSAAFRPTLSRRSAGTFVFSVCLGRPPPNPLNFWGYRGGEGDGGAQRSPVNGEPVALGSPSLPRPNNGGRAGGGRGWLGGIFLFFLFLPSLFSLYSPTEKQKPHGIKATMNGSRDAECAAG